MSVKMSFEIFASFEIYKKLKSEEFSLHSYHGICLSLKLLQNRLPLGLHDPSLSAETQIILRLVIIWNLKPHHLYMELPNVEPNDLQLASIASILNTISISQAEICSILEELTEVLYAFLCTLSLT